MICKEHKEQIKSTKMLSFFLHKKNETSAAYGNLSVTKRI